MLKPQAGVGGIVHGGWPKRRRSLLFRLREQIAGPDPIAGCRWWYAMFQLAACFEDEVLVLLLRHLHIALVRRRLSPTRPAAIEVTGYGAAAGVGHEGFEPDHFIADPRRLRGRANAPSRI